MIRRSIYLCSAEHAGRALAAAVTVVASGCATVQPAPPETFTQTVTVSAPRVSPLPQTVAAQTRGGVSISLAPRTAEASRGLMCQYQPHQAMVLFMPAGATKATHSLFREARFEAPTLASGDVEFVFTIRNQMDRVFRGAGAVLQFSVNGQARPVAQDAYLDILNTIILPREEKQIVIRGPATSTLVQGGSLGVFLYDVVTTTDAAGNVQARQNFEWYYNVTSQEVSEPVSALRRTVWIPNDGARVINGAPGRITRCFDGVYPKDDY